MISLVIIDGNEIVAVNRGNKRIKGPTTCRELWVQQEGFRQPISINRRGQPIGGNTNKLSSFLGTIARNGALAPLHYEDWRLMPEDYKSEMWKLVEVRKLKYNPIVVIYKW